MHREQIQPLQLPVPHNSEETSPTEAGEGISSDSPAFASEDPKATLADSDDVAAEQPSTVLQDEKVLL